MATRTGTLTTTTEMHFAAPFPCGRRAAGHCDGRDCVLSYCRPLFPLARAQRWALMALGELTPALVVGFCAAGSSAAARGRSRSRRAGARGRVGQHADCGCGRRHPAGARRRDPRARPRAGAVRMVYSRGGRGRGCLDCRVAWRQCGPAPGGVTWPELSTAFASATAA